MDPRELSISVHYRYEDFFVSAEGSWLMTPSFGFEMSFQIMLQEATIRFNSNAGQPLQILPRDGDAITPECPEGDGYEREIEHFVRCVKGESVEPLITPEASRDAVALIHEEVRAAKEKRVIEVNT